MNKRIVAANDLLRDSFKLAADVYESGFRPDFLVGLWRGGSAVGIAVQEGLDYFGVPTDHIAIRTSYSGADTYEKMVTKKRIRVHGLEYLLDNLCSHHSLLIVDDVLSTGKSLRAVLTQLKKKTRRNLPHDIRIATVWFRPTDKTLRRPDYFVHETSDWLVLPYELTGMSIDDIKTTRPELSDIAERLRDWCQR
jgi:hypoxanthine phosphoribosyltransferase